MQKQQLFCNKIIKLITCVLLLTNGLHAQLTNFGKLYLHPGSNISVSGTVINSGAATDLLNSGTLLLTGDFTNNGNDLNAAGTGTVIFNGTTTQQINGTQASSFYNVTQWNTGNLVLTNNQLIDNKLELAAGSLLLNNNTLTVNGGLTHFAGSLSSTPNSGLILNGSWSKFLYFKPGNHIIKTLTVNASATNVYVDDSLHIAGTGDGVLTVNGNLASNGFLTLKSDAGGTARLAPSTGSILGKVTVERYYPAQRSWRLITAPVTNTGSIYNEWQNGGVNEASKDMLVTGPSPSAANGLDASQQNNYSMYSWNVNTQALAGVANTKDSTLSFNQNSSADNKGYFAFVRGDRDPSNTMLPYSNITTLSSKGKLQMGTQIFIANNTAGKYTLIGNPYASPVDFNTLTRQNLVKRFYAWDPSINEVGGYVMLDDLDNNNSYIKSVSGSAQDNHIQSSQAFFVETVASAPASLTFTENNKSAVNNLSVFRPAGDENGHIRVGLYIVQADSSERLADETLTEFNDNFNEGINYEDGLKFSNINENISQVRNGSTLCAERRPLVTDNDTIFFKLTKTRQFNYRLHIQADDVSAQPVQAFLEDSYTATQTPITVDGLSQYDFVVNADPLSSAAGRFRIVFRQLSVLPVTFVEIKGATTKEGNFIKWIVENEINIATYTIERSADGVVFENAGTRNSSGSNTYAFTDTRVDNATYFYRISATGNGGQKWYSNVIKIAGKAFPAVSVYPNPVTNNRFSIAGIPAGKHTISIIGSNGQVIYTKIINRTANNQAIQVYLPVKVAAGSYELIIQSENNEPVHTLLDIL